MTAQAVRQKRQERHGALFSLKHVDERKLFGTKSVWRHQTRVPVSYVQRTIIDLLDDPAVGGGIQHVADCLTAYLRRGDRDDEKLIEYAVRLGNGAVESCGLALTSLSQMCDRLLHKSGSDFGPL